MKRNLFSATVFGVLMILLTSLLPVQAHGSSPSVPAGGPDRVTPHEARQAAAWQVIAHGKTETASIWKRDNHLQVGQAVPVRDTDNSLIAYLVNVKANGTPAGFVMVSAYYDEEPVLMWSDAGSAFSTDKVQGKLADKAAKVAQKDVVWLGGPYLAAKFRLQDGTETTVAMDGESKTGHIPGWYKVPSENADARQAWGVIKKIQVGAMGETNPSDGVTDLNPDLWELDQYGSLYARNYLSSTDGINMKQWAYSGNNYTGCSPTAGSNVIYWWATVKGKGNLNPSGQSDIVMALRTAMGTTQLADGSGSTNPFNISPGLQSYARGKGYSTATASMGIGPTYAGAKAEIDAGRPWLLSTSGNAYFNGGHTVFVVGYKQYKRCGNYSCTYPGYVVFRNNFVDERDSNGNLTHNLFLRWGTWSTSSIDTFNIP